MGGGKRTRERALPKNSGLFQKSFWSAQLWIFVQEKQSNDTRGGWKTYRTRGVQNPFLGRVSFVRFSSPFFHPPMASSDRLGMGSTYRQLCVPGSLLGTLLCTLDVPIRGAQFAADRTAPIPKGPNKAFSSKRGLFFHGKGALRAPPIPRETPPPVYA